MDYDKIPQVLKRHSFEEKMNVLQFYSKQLMTPTGLVPTEKLQNSFLPWELEVMLLFSITSKEWTSNDFNPKSSKDFANAIMSIRNYIHPTLDQKKETIAFLDSSLVSMGAIQLDRRNI